MKGTEHALDHLAQLNPLLKPLKLDASTMAMLPVAAAKKPENRGPFDTMVFDELSKRFTDKLDSLRTAVSTAASTGSEKATAAKSAQAEVDQISGGARAEQPADETDDFWGE